jgi:hypothetical protein
VRHGKIENFGNFQPKLIRGQLELFKDIYSLLTRGSAVEMAILVSLHLGILSDTESNEENEEDKTQVDQQDKFFMQINSLPMLAYNYICTSNSQ